MRFVLALCAVCGLTLAPAVARAQPGAYVTPSIAVSGGYDDNVFSAADQDDDFPPPDPDAPPPPPIPERLRVENDFFTRVSPGIDLSWLSEPLALSAGYTADGEAYLDHSNLNDVPIRQAARFSLRWLPDRRTTFSLRGSWTETETPGDLNVITAVPAPAAAAPPGAPPSPGAASPPDEPAPIDPSLTGGDIETGRRRSTAVNAGPTISYALGPLTTTNAGYAFTRTKQDGGIENLTHSATWGLDRHITPRDDARLDYGFRHFTSDRDDDEAETMPPPDPDPFDDEQTSHFVTAGWNRRITRNLTAEVAGGPRFTEGAIDPEVSARLSYLLQRGLLRFDYRRTQSVATGVGGAIETESFIGSADYVITPFLALRLAGSFSKNEQERQDSDVWRSTAALTYALREWMNVFVSYDFVFQDGSLDVIGADPEAPVSRRDREITRNLVLVGVAVTYPYRVY